MIFLILWMLRHYYGISYFTAGTYYKFNLFINSIQFYLYSAKSQQKSSHNTLHIEQVETVLFIKLFTETQQVPLLNLEVMCL